MSNPTLLTWHVKTLINQSRSREDSLMCKDKIDSVCRAIDIYDYHHEEASKSNEFVQCPTAFEQMDSIHTFGNKRIEIDRHILIAQAHAQASVHSARAIHDLIAQLINIFILNSSINEPGCSIQAVEKNLDQCSLKSHLGQFLTSTEFQYVNSFVNTIKHRNLISFNEAIDFSKDKHGLFFKEFVFNKNTYTKKSLVELLSITHTVKNKAIEFGILVNQELGLD
jgi:hypothetical protein